MTPEPGLQVEAAFARGAFRLEAVFDAEPGVTAIIGASGAGKTTLLSGLAGHTPLVDGVVRCAGAVWADAGARRALAVRKRGLASVFQEGRLFPHLTVRGNLDYARKRARGRSIVVYFDDVVARLGLEALLERRPAQLSGGERQRVALARALLAAPRLLLMDEPLASLDARTRAEAIDLIATVLSAAAIPVVYATHQPEEALRLAHRIGLIKAGRLRPLRALRHAGEDAGLARFFGGDGPGAVVEGRLVSHDLKTGLALYETDIGPLIGPGAAAPAGARVRGVLPGARLRIEPETEGAERRHGHLPAKVIDAQAGADGRAFVALSVQGKRVYARIGRRASGLEKGADVRVIVDAAAWEPIYVPE